MNLSMLHLVATTIAGYILTFISLYLGSRISNVPGAGIKKVATAAVIPALVLGLFGGGFYLWVIIRSVGALKSGIPELAVSVFFLFIPMFLAVFIGSPWLLSRREDEGWGRAWNGSALGGLILVLLTILASFPANDWLTKQDQIRIKALSRHALRTQYGTAAQPSLDVPYPLGTVFDSAIIITNKDEINQARSDPNHTLNSQDWFNRWPCNETVSFGSSMSPANLSDFLEAALNRIVIPCGAWERTLSLAKKASSLSCTRCGMESELCGSGTTSPGRWEPSALRRCG